MYDDLLDLTGDETTITGGQSEVYFTPLTRHYLVASVRHPGMIGDDRMPQDRKLTSAAARFVNMLTEPERDVIRLFAGVETSASMERSRAAQKQFQALQARFAVFAGLADPVWLPTRTIEPKGEKQK